MCGQNNAMLENTANLFDIPRDSIYLNTAGVGPRLHAAQEAAQRAVADGTQPWHRPGAATPEEQMEALRALGAGVFGCEADGLAFVPSVSYGIAVAARNLPLQAGQSVVLLSAEYPSNRAIWQRSAAKAGAQIINAVPEAGEDWTSAVLRCIDERTAVVCVAPCHWRDGAPLDLALISERAHSAGAALVVDVAQTLGVLDFDFAGVAPDFVACAGFKWLLGANALGWLWTAPRWREAGEPLEESWVQREIHSLSDLGDTLPPYRPGARRFDAGGTQHPVNAAVAAAALEQIRDWGVPAIRGRLNALLDYLRRKLDARGLGDWLDAAHSPHICALRPPRDALPAVADALAQRRIILPRRGDGLRIAPYLHVDETAMDAVVDTVAVV